jgi:hypothetical protein
VAVAAKLQRGHPNGRADLCVGEQTERTSNATSTLTPSPHFALGSSFEGLAMMIRRKPTQPSKPSTLAQQQSDFTAEGSPPPGDVAASSPVTARETAVLSVPARARPIRKGPPLGRSRWQR